MRHSWQMAAFQASSPAVVWGSAGLYRAEGSSYDRFGPRRFLRVSGKPEYLDLSLSTGGEHVSPGKGKICGEGWNHGSDVGCLIHSACSYLRALRRGRRSLRADQVRPRRGSMLARV